MIKNKKLSEIILIVTVQSNNIALGNVTAIFVSFLTRNEELRRGVGYSILLSNIRKMERLGKTIQNEK